MQGRENDIAVVGLAARYPSSPNVETYWRNIAKGIDCIRYYSERDLRSAGVPEVLLTNPRYVKARGSLDAIEEFDSSFFSITPREADILDPQKRIFLQSAYHSLEDAGCDPFKYSGRIGVFAGCDLNFYMISHLLTNRKIVEQLGPDQIILANDKDYLSTRLSYKLNLRGPSIVLQTACSTSLACIHYAAQSLLNGECDIALAGGVSVNIPNDSGYLFVQGGISSPDGRCCAFDRNARGTVPGSGAGVVVLRPAEDAMRDGDRIYAILKATAINNDGADKVGFTAPSVSGQSSVIRECHVVAGVGPDEIGYVEAHGTGTVLGDPIEVEALTTAFRLGTEKRQFCALGSVKTNIGHTGSAAGVAGFIKACLSLYHGQIPPTLNYQETNPNIDFATSPFYVNSVNLPWPESSRTRYAGVSSFGIGGTNVHALIQEKPRGQRGNQKLGKRQIVLLSAKTPTALREMRENLCQFISENPDESLGDIAFSLRVGRPIHQFRFSLTASDAREAAAILKDSLSRERESKQPVILPKIPVTQFRFGEGALANACYERIVSDRVERMFACIAGFKTPTEMELLIAKQIAIADIWVEMGIRPKSVVFHGIGRFAAACNAGFIAPGNLFNILFDLRSEGHEGFGYCIKKAEFSEPRLPMFNGSVKVELNEIMAESFWKIGRIGGSSSNREIFAGDLIVDFGFLECDALVRSSDRNDAQRIILDGSDLAEGASLLWESGFQLDWRVLETESSAKKVGLPVYPFARTRHWIACTESGEFRPNDHLEFQETPKSQWLYEPIWVRHPFVVKAQNLRSSRARDWLVLGSHDPLSVSFASILGSNGEKASYLGIRDLNNGKGEGKVFDGYSDDEFNTLLARNVYSTNSTLNLVDFRPTFTSSEGDSWSDYRECLRLIKMLLVRKNATSIEVTIVTSGSSDVLGSEELRPRRASLHGLVRVAAQEGANLSFRIVDLDLKQANESGRERDLNALYRIVIERNAGVSAIREGSVWTQSFRKMAEIDKGQPPFRKGGIYLITGGLGRIGLTLAEYLTQKFDARVALTTTSLFPNRAKDTRLTGDVNIGDVTEGRIKAIEKIESRGGQLEVIHADAADFQSMERAFELIENKWGRVDGIFHLAGVVRSGIGSFLTELDPAEAERQMRPKVEGHEVLERIISSRRVDFCAVFSSLAVYLGGWGFGAYAAANSAMDLCARRAQRSHGCAWKIINWDGWDLAASAGDNTNNAKVASIHAKEGIEVLEHVLSNQRNSAVAISISEMETRIARSARFRDKPEYSGSTSSRSADVATIDDVERIVEKIWSEILGIQFISKKDNFFALGGDSLQAVQCMSLIEKQLDLVIPLTMLIAENMGTFSKACMDRKLGIESITTR